MKEKEVVPVEKRQPVRKADDWKKEHNEKKFYDSITFKGIKIGYTGDLMDDENVPF
ncbi:hypothetical protein ACRC6Q_16585 [Planococcus sp. SE5232]|uniref:hypothetical protein n=1 Tax=unclassified Planococcus (in: firmicutes) TaxID=2662419 RepID=UPI003D6B19FB